MTDPKHDPNAVTLADHVRLVNVMMVAAIITSLILLALGF